jgi:hypothetical protein
LGETSPHLSKPQLNAVAEHMFEEMVVQAREDARTGRSTSTSSDRSRIVAETERTLVNLAHRASGSGSRARRVHQIQEEFIDAERRRRASRSARRFSSLRF